MVATSSPQPQTVTDFAIIASQVLVLCLLAARLVGESRTFQQLLPWVPLGFAIHYWLPSGLRLRFFALLSVASVVFALGVTVTGWDHERALQHGGMVVLIGLTLIAVCRAPFSFRLRVVVLLGIVAVLAWARTHWLAAPPVAAIWPVLGSMFMFRLILYVYDTRDNPQPASLSRTLAYFFMLPTACFPLYPVIDWRSFERDYFNDDPLPIYRSGVRWMAHGLLHWTGYRIINQHWYIDPSQVTDGPSLAQHCLGNYALYLRVSAQFHWIAGTLHLFGWNLPRTNHHYLLAASFTDYWRRVNIYWKDFMSKVFYNPVAFRLRKLGATRAVAGGSAVVFVATWGLHAHQSFWLSGDSGLSAQDALFWGILAVLVMQNAAWEATHRRRRQLVEMFSWTRSTSDACRTGVTFAILCVLWSLWSCTSVSAWLDMWKHADGMFGLLVVLILLAVGAVKIVVDFVERMPRHDRAPIRTSPGAFSPRVSRSRGLAVAAGLLVAVSLVFGASHSRALRQAATIVARGGPYHDLPQKGAGGYYERLLSASYAALDRVEERVGRSDPARSTMAPDLAAVGQSADRRQSDRAP